MNDSVPDGLLNTQVERKVLYASNNRINFVLKITYNYQNQFGSDITKAFNVEVTPYLCIDAKANTLIPQISLNFGTYSDQNTYKALDDLKLAHPNYLSKTYVQVQLNDSSNLN